MGMPRRVFMSADAVGGVWRYALELARGFSDRGVETRIAVLGPAPGLDQLREAAAIGGLEVTATALPLDWTATSEAELLECSAVLKAMALRSGADIVHLNAPALAGRDPWPIPLVVAAHSCVGTWWNAVRREALPEDFVWRTRLTARGLHIADCAIAPSRSFAASIEAFYGVGVRIVPVLNGTRPLSTRPVRRRHCVFTAGRLWDEGKNMAALDRAAAHLPVPVYAAGPVEGPNRERREFRHLQLLGRLTPVEMARWYATAPVFASLSRYEPFGLTVLEAAQAGAALVLSDIATFRELWDGVAWFVPPDDYDMLASALDYLTQEPAVAAELGAKARLRAARYTVDRMVAATLDVYASIPARQQLAKTG